MAFPQKAFNKGTAYPMSMGSGEVREQCDHHKSLATNKDKFSGSTGTVSPKKSSFHGAAFRIVLHPHNLVSIRPETDR
jgi:hypothetical protein